MSKKKEAQRYFIWGGVFMFIAIAYLKGDGSGLSRIDSGVSWIMGKLWKTEAAAADIAIGAAGGKK